MALNILNEFPSTSMKSGKPSGHPDLLHSEVTERRDALLKGTLVSKKKQLTILLVGETGVGKTALLDFIGNALQGLGPETYQQTHFPSNEAGGSKAASQTKEAMVYEFESLNGIRIRVLDTPGLADTRGLVYDDEHKSSIVQAISDKIETIDGVLIVANGTIERLPAATDYTLTTLASIFPRSIVDNVAFIFTMVSNPLHFNFKLDNLPEPLKNAKYYLLENPIVQYKQLRLQATLPQSAMNLNKTRQAIDKNYLTSIAMLVKLFGWLDQREPRQTTAIVKLYETSCNIDRRIQNVVELRGYLGTLLESEKAAQGASQETADLISEMQEKVACEVGEIRRLFAEYKMLSLSGNLSQQFAKTVALLELSLRSLDLNGADMETIGHVEKSIKVMRMKEMLVEEAVATNNWTLA